MGFDSPVFRIGVALALGLLIGVERERRKLARAVPEFAGLRTFGLVGLLGGACAHFGGTPMLVLGFALVALLTVAAYIMAPKESTDRGITTEVALLLTYVLGALAQTEPGLAAGLAVVVAYLLGLRRTLHHVVRDLLSPEELHDGLAFLLIALVVLPLMPDRALGPYRAVNPASITRLVVVLTALSGAGYAAQRWLGARFGMVVSGFAGGFVSSSATIAACAMRAREQPLTIRAAAAGALASCVATVVEYIVLLGATDLALLRSMALPLGAALLAALIGTGLYFAGSGKDDQATSARGRAFRLPVVAGLGVVVGLVAILSAGLQARFGTAGVVVVSLISGFVDAHATSGSVAGLYHSGEVGLSVAEPAILCALSSNTLTKLVMASAGRSLRFTLLVGPFVLAIAGAAWLGFWWS
jgi:uncharacterized membrane protein (DUF4010 family)